MKWRDRREIYCLSTKHLNSFEPMGGNHYKPSIIVGYNKGKSKIDLSDQMSSYSNPLRKSLKWYRKIAFDILLWTSLINALTIFKTVTNKYLKINDLRLEIIKKLVYQCEAIPQRNLEVFHNLSKNHKRSKCSWCYKSLVQTSGRLAAQNKCKKVKTFCDQCQKPMCPDCFLEHHNHII